MTVGCFSPSRPSADCIANRSDCSWIIPTLSISGLLVHRKLRAKICTTTGQLVKLRWFNGCGLHHSCLWVRWKRKWLFPERTTQTRGSLEQLFFIRIQRLLPSCTRSLDDPLALHLLERSSVLRVFTKISHSLPHYDQGFHLEFVVEDHLLILSILWC